MREVALVTGSSRGIGAATAALLARSGYAVCINYIEREDKAEELAAVLRAEGCTVITHQADVADAEAVKAMVQRVEKELGHVTLLVNNAGIARSQQFQDIEPEYWQRIFAVNLGGCFNCTQAVLPHMLHEHSGCIINTSSIWGMHSASCEAAYSATKHAIIGLSKSLAVELGPSGIRVNCVAPGSVDTDMLRPLGQEALDSFCENEVPIGRLAKPEEIAKAILFLARDASYTTGHVLVCDGGYLA